VEPPSDSHVESGVVVEEVANVEPPSGSHVKSATVEPTSGSHVRSGTTPPEFERPVMQPDLHAGTPQDDRDCPASRAAAKKPRRSREAAKPPRSSREAASREEAAKKPRSREAAKFERNREKGYYPEDVDVLRYLRLVWMYHGTC